MTRDVTENREAVILADAMQSWREYSRRAAVPGGYTEDSGEIERMMQLWVACSRERYDRLAAHLTKLDRHTNSKSR